MRIILLTLQLIICSIICFSQSALNQKLYSLAIAEDLRYWDPEGDSIKGIVVIKNTDSGSLESNYEMLLDISTELNNGKQIQYSLLGIYKESVSQFKSNPELALLTKELASIFLNQPSINATEFELAVNVEMLEETKLNSMKKKNYKRFWKRFYKKFPDTLGYYSFSKVVYHEKFAAFYVSHMWNGLGGSGDVIYLNKNTTGWKIIAVLNLWTS